MNEFTGKINIPTLLTGSNYLDVKVADGKRLVNIENLESLFNILEINNHKDSIEIHRFNNEWVTYKAMKEVLFREYLRFNNEMITIIFDGIANVGLLPLIDEATGYDKVVMAGSYYQRIFNKNLMESKDV